MSPRKPPRPCNASGCPNLSHGPYCPEHQQQRRRQRAPRPSATQRGYDRQWRKVRDAMLAAEPMCRQCRVRPAVDLHHTIPGVNDPNSLVPMCRSCHNVITRGRNR